MAQVLYRKYRSRSFDEVVGQDHIVKTLKKAIKDGRVSHAYLFTGPRGVGKTSVARILAREVNQLPYRDEGIHLDIIEIDAASNRRIDEIRELRERVHIAPTSAKYKVYIIDEVHMLTREAFNALLKTLEEPPAHSIFILATTEAHKLPETIVSRTQRFSFKPISVEQIAEHLANVAKKEKVDITPDALTLLAEHADGSLRDSLGLLDQLGVSGRKIDEKQARVLLGLPSSKSVEQLLLDVDRGDTVAIIRILTELKEQGVNPAMTAKQIGQRIRALAASTSLTDNQIKLLRSLIDVPASANPAESLELSLLEAAASNYSGPTKVASFLVEEEKSSTRPSVEAEIKSPKPSKKPYVSSFDLTRWPDVLARLKQEAPSLYTAAKLAHPQIDGHNLELVFQFPLHQKKVSSTKHLDTIGQVIEDISGSKLKISCVVDKRLVTELTKKPRPEKTATEPKALQSISNIFGQAEMLES